jgi:hypothetical protein
MTLSGSSSDIDDPRQHRVFFRFGLVLRDVYCGLITLIISRLELLVYSSRRDILHGLQGLRLLIFPFSWVDMRLTYFWSNVFAVFGILCLLVWYARSVQR